MTQLGPRIPHGSVRLVGRNPVDYAQELQDYLGEMGSLAAVVNTLLSTLDIEVGGGEVTVSGGGDGGMADIFLLMGA